MRCHLYEKTCFFPLWESAGGWLPPFIVMCFFGLLLGRKHKVAKYLLLENVLSRGNFTEGTYRVCLHAS